MVDYRALGRLYLVPHLGLSLLGEIDAEAIMDMKGKLQAAAGAKASGKEGSGKALSPRSVAKILTLGGTVHTPEFTRCDETARDDPNGVW